MQKNLLAIFGGVGAVYAVIAVIAVVLNLAFLGAAVWVIVMVLQHMGVI